MAQLIPNEGQGSRDAWAVIARTTLEDTGIKPEDYPRYCVAAGSEIRVRVSPTSLRYLEGLASDAQDGEVAAAIPYAAVNGRPSLWTTDFALSHGARTREDVLAWHRKFGLRSQAKDVGSLLVPESDRGASVFVEGSDMDVHDYLESILGTPAYRVTDYWIELELPEVGKDRLPLRSGETTVVRFAAPAEWSIEAPEGGQLWHVIAEGASQTLCTIPLASWKTARRRDDDHAVTCPWCRARNIAIEIAAPPSFSRDNPVKVVLHDEIARILRSSGKEWLTTQEIAQHVNDAGNFHKRDRSPVTAFQIHGRTKNYPKLFDRDGARVKLRES
jgi:hypothetical protein